MINGESCSGDYQVITKNEKITVLCEILFRRVRGFKSYRKNSFDPSLKREHHEIALGSFVVHNIDVVNHSGMTHFACTLLRQMDGNRATANQVLF